MQVNGTNPILDDLSLPIFRGLFHRLAIPHPIDVYGLYRGQFVGPFWVQALAQPALRLGGLPGWWGKRFNDQGEGVNLLKQNGEIVARVPVRLEMRVSHIDGLPGLTLIYPDSSPFPLFWIRDELRWLNEQTLLGLTMPVHPLLSTFAFPFILKREGERA